MAANNTAADHGDKFNAYRTISSFQEYVLVNQYRQNIEHYIKTAEKHWSFRKYDTSDQQLSLEKTACAIFFTDLYDEVDFTLEGTEG
ncbi:MAG: Uma2 family endonuclease [Cyanobacteria bacterium P01_H01_bin.26]